MCRTVIELNPKQSFIQHKEIQYCRRGKRFK